MNEEMLKRQFDETRANLTIGKAALDHQQRQNELRLYPRILDSRVDGEKRMQVLEFLDWYRAKHGLPDSIPIVKWCVDGTDEDYRLAAEDEYPFEAITHGWSKLGFCVEKQLEIWLKADLTGDDLLVVLGHELGHFSGPWRSEDECTKYGHELVAEFKRRM